ncbi:hypothetical protein QS306_15530 [Paraburkholderia bonniea]|uniref:hypothetical protein n=1 Tax=Paraburkholderia bonniea TaxID=2152891 RepID=UPI00257321DB|nr:hypothetical protein [Paraburkholderia bonniea]WJF91500.1 hypothetical protein QS306_15530 [Paraburkholderia bonniea]WJF94818.1 hypothetical protein QS308_15535 [Paraburkholderia bonniea]
MNCDILADPWLALPSAHLDRQAWCGVVRRGAVWCRNPSSAMACEFYPRGTLA